jgi:hypothetical protein
MKDLRITTADGSEILTVCDAVDGVRPRAVALVQVEYPEQNTTQGVYLTPKRAAKLRDWLARWIQEVSR